MRDRCSPPAGPADAGAARVRDTARALGLAAVLALAAGTATAAPAADPYADERRAMVETVRAIAASPFSGAPGGRISDDILAVMEEVPRHELVPERHRHRAYRDGPLPIGHDQTISQPYIVALMTELLDVDSDDSVLEVGTGSGYQAAVLSRLVRRVYTIEIVDALARRARRDLTRLGYRNVEVHSGDGYRGWPEHAPFDGIIATAAAPEIPPPLLAQLKPGGRLVIPVGGSGWRQSLLVVEKGDDGTVSRRAVIDVRFVPLTRERR